MILYTLNGQTQNDLTLPALVQLAQGNANGPLPTLSQRQNMIPVSEGDYQIVTFGGQLITYTALPLLTCAAVAFTSTAPGQACGVLYHAPSGTLTAQIVQQARQDLGNPAWGSIVAVYAFPQPSDPNYQADAMVIETCGVTPNNVVYMPNLPASHFCYSTQGFVGV